MSISLSLLSEPGFCFVHDTPVVGVRSCVYKTTTAACLDVQPLFVCLLLRYISMM